MSHIPPDQAHAVYKARLRDSALSYNGGETSCSRYHPRSTTKVGRQILPIFANKPQDNSNIRATGEVVHHHRMQLLPLRKTIVRHIDLIRPTI